MGRPSRNIILAATAAVVCAACAYLFHSVAFASGDSIGSLRGGGEDFAVGGRVPHSRALWGYTIAHSRDPKNVVAKKAPAALPWTPEEHALFMKGLRYWGDPGHQTWSRIARVLLKARTVQQVADHWTEYHAANHDKPGFPLFEEDDGPDDAGEGEEAAAAAADARTACGTPPFQSDYRGTVSATASGRTCAAWDATSPQFHQYTFPDEGPHNYCRNPSNSPGGAWCFTSDPVRFENCNVPRCPGAWTPEEHELFLKGVDWYVSRLSERDLPYFSAKGRLPDNNFKAISRVVVKTRSVAEVVDHFDEWIRTTSGPATNTGLPWTEEEEKALDNGLAKWGHEGFGLRIVSWKYVPTRSFDEIRDHTRQLFYGDGAPPEWSDGWTPEEHAAFLEGLQRAQGTSPWQEIARYMRERLPFSGKKRFTPRTVLQHTIEYYVRRGRGEFAPTEVSEWPPDNAPIPPGTYSRRAVASHHPMALGAGAASHAATAPWGRVLLYISSHFSEQHRMYLRYCWRNVLARSQILRGADVAVHLTPNDPALRRPAMDLFRDVFEEHNLMMFVRDYSEVKLRGGMDHEVTKKTGAVMTMYEAVHYNYFEGYDWVIRVNPDVLLRDDSWFQEAMSDPSLSALIVDCHGGKKYVHLHTDFFVVKPEVLMEEAFPRYILKGGAEGSFTAALTNTVLKSDPPSYAWVPDADPVSKRTCRVGEGRDFLDSPVVHEHMLHPEVCTVPREDALAVHAAFPGGIAKTGWKLPDYSSWYK